MSRFTGTWWNKQRELVRITLRLSWQPCSLEMIDEQLPRGSTMSFAVEFADMHLQGADTSRSRFQLPPEYAPASTLQDGGSIGWKVVSAEPEAVMIQHFPTNHAFALARDSDKRAEATTPAVPWTWVVCAAASIAVVAIAKQRWM